MSAETILVVDDNEQNRMVVEAVLVSAGYVVTQAVSGDDALRIFKEWTPDLVLLDVLMPGMDGFETCRQLRTLPQGMDVPVVFLTALGDIESHNRALDSGGDDLLSKPINRTELLLRVRSMTWLHRLRVELRSGYNLIRSQRDALIRSQHQKEELTGLIAHDLKNPLTNIIGYSELILRSKSPMTQERILEIAQRMVACGRTMERMIMNLLDINRSEDGALAPKLSAIDIPGLVEEVRKGMEVRASEKGVTLSITENLAGNTVLADSDLVRRLIENLLDNSIRYAPTGSTLRLDLRTLQDQGLEIRVRDEGRGIAKEFREKIFEKYAQVGEESQAQTRSNRGLGLTFCRLAAEAHGGRIWVEDNRPKGACFCVQLPREPGAKLQPLPA